MPRRRAGHADAVAKLLGVARARAAHFLGASPMLRFALEFLVAQALAAWSGAEAQYDRIQDHRIAEVVNRLDNIQGRQPSMRGECTGPRCPALPAKPGMAWQDHPGGPPHGTDAEWAAEQASAPEKQYGEGDGVAS